MDFRLLRIYVLLRIYRFSVLFSFMYKTFPTSFWYDRVVTTQISLFSISLSQSQIDSVNKNATRSQKRKHSTLFFDLRSMFQFLALKCTGTIQQSSSRSVLLQCLSIFVLGLIRRSGNSQGKNNKGT